MKDYDDAPSIRRRLLTELSSEPATATSLAGELPISRQAVTKHLDSLARAGLLTRERSGREVIYRVTPQPLADAAHWMMSVAGQWDARLERLRQTLDDRLQS